MRKLSKAEIVQLVQENGIADYTNLYKVVPSVTAPYTLGSVRADVQQAGLDRLNKYRALAGIRLVEINNDYTKYAQSVSVVNAANNVMSHFPAKPSGMQDDLYNNGSNGACKSNIACFYGYTPAEGPLSLSVDIWMNDSNDHNIATLGHRRWALNPSMASTGFGCATATDGTVHTTMYAFDNAATIADYDFISWPPSGYMANDTEFFTTEHAWNVTLNNQKYDISDLSQIKVTIKNSDGKSWVFGNKNNSNGFFNIDTDGYGSASNSIIFRPAGITEYKGTYTVTIEGIKTKTNSLTTLTFKVEFFSAKNYKNTQSETTQTTTVTETTATETQTQTTSVPKETTPIETTTVQQEKIITGDANDDEKVNASDARLALRFAAKLESPTKKQALAADVIKDGKLTASDARKILRVSAKLENFEIPEFFAEQTVQTTNAETTTVSESTQITTAATETTTSEAPNSDKSKTTETSTTAVITTIAQTTKNEHTTKTHNEETTYVYVTPTGKKYHKSTCRTINEAKNALICEAAKEKGYDACKVCKP